MLFNAFIIAFVSSFIAVVVLGHYLLLIAIWPDLFGKREPRPNQRAPGDVRSILQPNP